MKVQKMILGAMARELTSWQAAQIIGISHRSQGRWQQRRCRVVLGRQLDCSSPDVLFQTVEFRRAGGKRNGTRKRNGTTYRSSFLVAASSGHFVVMLLNPPSNGRICGPRLARVILEENPEDSLYRRLFS